MRAIKSLDSIFFYACVRNSCQKRPNFLSQWEQLKVLAPYCLQANFRNSCHNKRPNFLSQWEQSKVLTPNFFVFTCAHEDSLRTKKIMAKQDTQLQSVIPQKQKYLIRRAIDTILFLPVSLWRFIVNKQILVFVKTLTITQVDVVVMIIAKPPRVCSILLVVCSSCLWFLLRYRDCGILEWNPVPFPIPSRTRIPSRYRFLRDTGWGLADAAFHFWLMTSFWVAFYLSRIAAGVSRERCPGNDRQIVQSRPTECPTGGTLRTSRNVCQVLVSAYSNISLFSCMDKQVLQKF